MKKTIGAFLLVAVTASGCDPTVRIDEIVDNQTNESIEVTLKKQNQEETVTIPAASDYQAGFEEAVSQSVGSFYSELDDSLATAIIDIRKAGVICKRNWRKKRNWDYNEFNEEAAELRFTVVDADF